LIAGETWHVPLLYTIGGPNLCGTFCVRYQSLFTIVSTTPSTETPGTSWQSATRSTRSSSDNSLAHHLSPTSRSDRSSLASLDTTAHPHPIAPSVTHRVLHVVAFRRSELSLRLLFITLFVSSWKGESYFLDKKLFTRYHRCLAGARFDVMHGFVCNCSPSNARISSKSRHSFRDENQDAIHLTWRKLEL
jgi:hypothetical protein